MQAKQLYTIYQSLYNFHRNAHALLWSDQSLCDCRPGRRAGGDSPSTPLSKGDNRALLALSARKPILSKPLVKNHQTAISSTCGDNFPNCVVKQHIMALRQLASTAAQRTGLSYGISSSRQGGLSFTNALRAIISRGFATGPCLVDVVEVYYIEFTSLVH